ncbi:IS1182 family transposase, partial [Methylicorpusculum sp.]|uniref:IS1182 family transposase n=1 Tax=Methylicorpusculum sp. TaxID=2713644 RepID=UPI002AB886EB
SSIESKYKGGGTSSYNPRMLIKVLVYAYMCNTFSGRKIEKQLKENVIYMWLSGYSTPDFRTLNLFRSQRLNGDFESIFTQVVELIHHEGLVSLDVQYIDGTKIESAANKYTFVWKGAVDTYDERLKTKVDAVLRQAETVICSEEEQVGTTVGINVEEFQRRVDKIVEKIEKVPSEMQKEIKKIRKESLPKMMGYERHREILQERGSYSKTDHDATFMRMKEDYMGNGQLKPGYNVQISTENQYITNYGIYQKPGDTTTLIDYLESFDRKYHRQSKEIVADSGYGSEQNYDYMLDNEIVPYVKYNYFHKDIRKERKRPSDAYTLPLPYYNSDDDYFVCSMGQHMTYIGKRHRKSEKGHVGEYRRYMAQDCTRCPIKGVCTKVKGNRVYEVNLNLMKQKQLIRELLTSERGLMHRSKRPIEPEAVFGQIKYDCGFKRFMLKSLPKVSVEFGLIALAHNLRKYARKVLSIDKNIPQKPPFLQRSNGSIVISIFFAKKQVA